LNFSLVLRRWRVRSAIEPVIVRAIAECRASGDMNSVDALIAVHEALAGPWADLSGQQIRVRRLALVRRFSQVQTENGREVRVRLDFNGDLLIDLGTRARRDPIIEQALTAQLIAEGAVIRDLQNNLSFHLRRYDIRRMLERVSPQIQSEDYRKAVKTGAAQDAAYWRMPLVAGATYLHRRGGQKIIDSAIQRGPEDAWWKETLALMGTIDALLHSGKPDREAALRYEIFQKRSRIVWPKMGWLLDAVYRFDTKEGGSHGAEMAYGPYFKFFTHPDYIDGSLLPFQQPRPNQAVPAPGSRPVASAA
jgi:hypothetical protein